MQTRTARRLIDHCRSVNPQVVCVDYFDTLVTRSVKPNDVKLNACHRLVESLGSNAQLDPVDLFELRRLAERKVSSASVREGLDPEFDAFTVAKTLHQDNDSSAVFDGVDIDEFVQCFVAADLASELATQRLNQPLVDALRLIANNSVVILVSDFYFPGVTFEEMLNSHGILDLFREVVVSCDHQLTKASGRLYPAMIEVLGPLAPENPQQILMIGDNAHSDGAMARANGLSTFAVPTMRAVSSPSWKRVARSIRRQKLSLAS